MGVIYNGFVEDYDFLDDRSQQAGTETGEATEQRNRVVAK